MTKKNDQEWLNNMRHTGAHILAHAVLNLFGEKTKFGIGPVIDTGFYYDFQLPRPIEKKDLARLEKEMRKLIKENIPMEKITLDLESAKKQMKDRGQTFKLDLISDIERGDREEVKGVKQGEVTFYKLGGWVDLCKGGHLKSSGEVPLNGFKLTHSAGAYWKGDESQPQLTRIYAAAFETEEELKEYLLSVEEAKKRDHKILGKKLDLFTFSELVGPGLPLWTPKGTILKNLLDDFIWSLRKQRGYLKVAIPHITKKDLYEKSGHWDKFKDELFRITTREGHEFALKPMNCPHHAQIFARKKFSYREMPQRYADTTIQYRDEQTGELSGLARVRAITIDDAHVFCRFSQIAEEIEKIWEIVDEFYKACGFPLEVHLSLHDPGQSNKYLGSPEVWEESENKLREIAKKWGVKPVEDIGEAAFYGPKVDFIAKDSLGRKWQVATIQLDMNQPERFDLTCTNEKGEDERIVMIHAAIAGSFERFLAIYIEHTAGVFPVWLAPVQIAILSISDEVNEYAKQVSSKLITQNSNLRIEVDDRSESIGKKIREAEGEKIPYMLIIGKNEEKENSVSVRQRGENDLGQMKLDQFAARIEKEIKTKSL